MEDSLDELPKHHVTWEGVLVDILTYSSALLSLVIIVPYLVHEKLRQQYPDAVLCFIAIVIILRAIAMIPSTVYNHDPIQFEDNPLCAVQGIVLNATTMECIFLLMFYMLSLLVGLRSKENSPRRRSIHCYYLGTSLIFIIIYATLPFALTHLDFKSDKRAFGPKGGVCTVQNVVLLFCIFHFPALLMSMVTIYSAASLFRIIRILKISVGHQVEANAGGILGRGFCGCNSGSVSTSSQTKFLSFYSNISVFAIVHSLAVFAGFVKGAVNIRNANHGTYYTLPGTLQNDETIVIILLVFIEALIIITAPHIRNFYFVRGSVFKQSVNMSMNRMSDQVTGTSCSNNSCPHSDQSGVVECNHCNKQIGSEPAEEFVDVNLE